MLQQPCSTIIDIYYGHHAKICSGQGRKIIMWIETLCTRSYFRLQSEHTLSKDNFSLLFCLPKPGHTFATEQIKCRPPAKNSKEVAAIIVTTISNRKQLPLAAAARETVARRTEAALDNFNHATSTWWSTILVRLRPFNSGYSQLQDLFLTENDEWDQDHALKRQ